MLSKKRTMSKIPVTVITGFLGSGKTTLLNNLIKKYPNKKFAIIENEFGATNIDSELVTNVKNEDIFELSNGCICCSLNAELYQVLQKLLSSGLGFNHLLIETTGIANPGSIIAPFVTDFQIKAQFQLDSVVCLVDAEHVKTNLEKEEVTAKQIATAYTLLLNKIDLISPKEQKDLSELLSEMNSQARLYTTSFSDINNHQIIGVEAYNMANIYRFVLNVANKQKDTSGPKPDNHGIEAHCFSLKKPLNQEAFALWLEAFLQFNPETIYRVKGIVDFKGVSNRILVQSVHTRIQANVGRPWDNSEERISQLVIIGKQLNKEIIQKNLEELSN